MFFLAKIQDNVYQKENEGEVKYELEREREQCATGNMQSNISNCPLEYRIVYKAISDITPSKLKIA